MTRHSRYAFIVSFFTGQFSDNTDATVKAFERACARWVCEEAGPSEPLRGICVKVAVSRTHSRMSAEIKATVLLTLLHFERL